MVASTEIVMRWRIQVEYLIRGTLVMYFLMPLVMPLKVMPLQMRLILLHALLMQRLLTVVDTRRKEF